MSLSHRLQVLIPELLDKEISRAAEGEHISKGEWVRQALELRLQQKLGPKSDRDPLALLSSLDAPTGDIEQILAETDAGRR